MKRTRPILNAIGLCLLILLCAIGFLCYADAAAAGVSEGLSLCMTTLMPATFPFVVLCGFVVHAGADRLFGKLLSPLLRLLHLPNCCGAVLLLGWLGGYPTAARGVTTLYQSRRLTRAQAERLLWCSMNAGPSFTVSVIGVGLTGSLRFGILLFCSHTIALLLIGMVTGFWSRREPSLPEPQKTQTAPPFTAALVQSVQDGARGIVNLCGFVMLFSAIFFTLLDSGILQEFSNILQKLGVPEALSETIFPLLWEIATGVRLAIPGVSPLWIVFTTGVGGLCVFAQVLATTLPVGIRKRYFFLSRLAQGGLAVGIFWILQKIIPLSAESTAVFSNTSDAFSAVVSASGTTNLTAWICGGMLLVLCLVFLLCRKGEGRYR